MKSLAKLLFCIILMSCFESIYAVTLKSSQLSLTKPTIINETSTIFLDTTITIDKQFELIKAGPQFNSLGATITFVTQKNHKIIVAPGGILDLSSFAYPYQSLFFSGAAAIIMQPGSEVYLVDHRLTINENEDFLVLDYN